MQPRTARPLRGLSGERSQKVRAAARAKAELRIFDGLRVTRARGLMEQLRAAGWIPPDLVIDEAARRPLEWRDDAGRRCVLVPWGGLQWEARRYRLPHEAAAARAADAERRRALERARVAACEHARLRERLDGLPANAAQYRAAMLREAKIGLGRITWMARDRWPGCAVSEASFDALREALAAVIGVLADAEYRVDARAAQRLRDELARLEARGDDAFQGFLHRLGRAPDAPLQG
jgi:hypothetical protein